MNSDEETPTISPPNLVPTTIKPPSTWLQRLYTSKGFPPDSDHTHFLSNKIDPPTHQTIPTKNIPQKHHHNNENENGADLINNILSELFCMGEYENPTRIIKNKISRKQHCPRIYLVPKNPDVVETVNVSVPDVVGRVKVSVPQNPDAVGKVKPVPLTLTGGKKVRVKVKVRRREEEYEEEEEEEEEGEDWDVSGYSQTEVTVIDTSVSDWKFDRVLYRKKKKKNVWKVGDTKGKGVLMNCGFGNKRKQSDNENVNHVYKTEKEKLKFRDAEENDVEKKKKKKKKKLILCNSLSYVDMDGGAPMVRMKSAQGHEQGTVVVAAFKLKQDNCSQAP